MDVSRCRGATVERQPEPRRKVGHGALHWVALIRFAERSQHPSASLPSCTHMHAGLCCEAFLFLVRSPSARICFPCSRRRVEKADSTFFAYRPLHVFNAPFDRYQPVICTTDKTSRVCLSGLCLAGPFPAPAGGLLRAQTVLHQHVSFS